MTDADTIQYRYDMLTAQDDGEMEHPQKVIQKYAPDAGCFEPHSVADCWTFFSPRLEAPPRFIRPI